MSCRRGASSARHARPSIGSTRSASCQERYFLVSAPNSVCGTKRAAKERNLRTSVWRTGRAKPATFAHFYVKDESLFAGF
jgi:hypothetical protein